MEQVKTKKKFKLFGNVHPAVISVWAALIAAAHLLPAVTLVGTGGTMSVSTMLLPLAGIFFGPIPGALCAAIGQFIGFLIAPSGAWLGMATWLIGTCTAFVAGCISRGKWYISIPMAVLGFVLWTTHPIGQKSMIFAWVFYGYGLLCNIGGNLLAKKAFLGKNVLLKAISIFFCGVGGLVVSASLANYATLHLFGTPAITWRLLTPVSPVERTMFSLAATIVGTPLLLGLPKIGIFVGPQAPETEEDLPDEPVLEQAAEEVKETASTEQ